MLGSKIKLKVCSIFILVCLLVSLVIPVTTVSAEPLTVLKTKTFIFNNNTNQKVIKNLPIPKCVNIVDISTDNGDVLNYNLNKDSQIVNVEVDNGKSNEYWDSTKYSKYVTTNSIGSSESGFKSSQAFSTEGYSGTLYKTGSAYVVGGNEPLPKFVTKTQRSSSNSTSSIFYNDGVYSGTISPISSKPISISKTVTGSAQSSEGFIQTCLSTGGRTRNDKYDPAKYKYSDISTWEYWEGNSIWSARKSLGIAYSVSSNFSVSWSGFGIVSAEYNDGKYRGNVSVSGGNLHVQTFPVYMLNPNNGYTPPFNNQDCLTMSNTYPYTLTGVVTATEYDITYGGTVWSQDTRLWQQDYSGYIYKGGYSTGYSYSITVTYEEDVLDLSVSQDPTEWTNQDVTLTAKGDSNFFDRILKPNGTSVSTKIATQTVPSNGTYTFRLYDKFNNLLTKSITVTNIDKILPSATFSSNSCSWTKTDKVVTITPSDSGGSGVKQWRYRVVNSLEPKSVWSSFDTLKNKTITLTNSGINLIEVEVHDNAGNISILKTGEFRIDKVPPSVDTEFVGTTQIKIIAEDTLSGISTVQYQFSDTPTSTLTSGFSYTSNNSLINLNSTKSYLHIKATDNVGNTSYTVVDMLSLTASIHKVLPTHEPVFKRGEQGEIRYTTKGKAERLTVDFPTIMSDKDKSLNKDIALPLLPVVNDSFKFYIPLNTPDGMYKAHVIAFKGGIFREVDLYFTVKGSILDDIRTRIINKWSNKR